MIVPVSVDTGLGVRGFSKDAASYVVGRWRRSRRITGAEVVVRLQRCARSYENVGWDTEQLADFLLCALDNLHTETQGVPDLPGWQDRANRRFQFAAAFFCAGLPKAEVTPDEKSVLLPLHNVPPLSPRNRTRARQST